MKVIESTATIIAGIFCILPLTINGHGILLDPPCRSSLWRFGYDSPPNYEDNELFCGGFLVQYMKNNGRCGICGDAYNQTNPRDNEIHGKYYSGIIARKYKSEDTIEATVQLTANHLGWFEFRVCPYNDETTEVTQECLDINLLKLADGSGTRFHIPEDSPSYITFNIKLKLPANLQCDHCLFQWHYNTGNSWGKCDDGTEQIGCGDQEVFRGCADISIQ